MSNEELDVHKKNEIVAYSPLGMLTQAVNQGLPPEVLEKLMDMADRYEAKQAKAEFFRALSKFQGEVPEILKTKQGHNNKYAPLSKIAKVIQPALERNGLSYRWLFEDVNNQIKCSCIVNHTAGHSEQDSMSAGKDSSGNKSEIHAIGSTRTYLQRYTLVGALGLSTADVDDDAKTGQQPKDEIPEPPNVEKVKEIKKCTTIKALETLWKSLTEKEQATYKNTFSTVRLLIEDANKKEK